MKNDQEKILYPFMQLSSMFEQNLNDEQKHFHLAPIGINLNLIQMNLQLEPS